MGFASVWLARKTRWPTWTDRFAAAHMSTWDQGAAAGGERPRRTVFAHTFGIDPDHRVHALLTQPLQDEERHVLDTAILIDLRPAASVLRHPPDSIDHEPERWSVAVTSVVGSDLPHGMSQGVCDHSDLLIAEPRTLRIPDGDVESGESTRPAVVQVFSEDAPPQHGSCTCRSANPPSPRSSMRSLHQPISIVAPHRRQVTSSKLLPQSTKTTLECHLGPTSADRSPELTGISSTASTAARAPSTWLGCQKGSAGMIVRTSSLTRRDHSNGSVSKRRDRAK